MSEEKPPSPSLLKKFFNKFFQQTLKPREQLMQALKEAEDNLVIDPYSRSVIEGAMQVESLRVRDVMVPRTKMTMISSEASTSELLKVMVSSYHSRFPIHNIEQDTILGIVLAKDLLAHFAGDNKDEFNFINPGFRVMVPFGKSKFITGVVLNKHNQVPISYEPKEIEFIIDDEPCITSNQLIFFKWISEYYMTSIGQVIKIALPKLLLLKSESEILLLKRFDYIRKTSNYYSQ